MYENSVSIFLVVVRLFIFCIDFRPRIISFVHCKFDRIFEKTKNCKRAIILRRPRLAILQLKLNFKQRAIIFRRTLLLK